MCLFLGAIRYFRLICIFPASSICHFSKDLFSSGWRIILETKVWVSLWKAPGSSCSFYIFLAERIRKTCKYIHSHIMSTYIMSLFIDINRSINISICIPLYEVNWYWWVILVFHHCLYVISCFNSEKPCTHLFPIHSYLIPYMWMVVSGVFTHILKENHTST